MINPHSIRYTERAQGGKLTFLFRHTVTGRAHNNGMPKTEIRQIFARNLREAMERAGMHQTALAQKAGMSGSHLSEVLRQLASVTIDLVADLAEALGIQPWELLADSKSAKEAALAKLLWGSRAADERVGETYKPAPPSKPRAKRSGRRKERGE